jgi:nitroreductase
MAARQDVTAVERRFGDYKPAEEVASEAERLHAFLSHRSCRAFADRPVAPALIDLLCASALSSPTKSDLQQRDIIVLEDAALRRQITALFPEYPWTATAPVFLVFCGNNRRQRQLHQWRGRPFVNDHLDAFFNPAVDAGIALGAFVAAAETVGIGCCPISAIRNHSQTVSDLRGRGPRRRLAGAHRRCGAAPAARRHRASQSLR